MGWDGPPFGRSSPLGKASLRLDRIPRKLPNPLSTDGVGFEPTRQFCCPHALQACALNHSATHPKVAKKPGLLQRRGWDGHGIPRHLSGAIKTEGVGFEPTRPFRVNALAGRRLKPLGHPSKLCPFGPPSLGQSLKLPRQGSNLDSSDPESDVLPVTPRGIHSDNNKSRPSLRPS